MKSLPCRAARVALVVSIASIISIAQAEMRSGKVFVHAVSGAVTGVGAGGIAQKLQAAENLEAGTVIRIGEGATADLILGYNGTVLRLTPNSVLRLVQLEQEIAGENVITQTKLELVSGALAGTQRKLASPSFLEITTPTAVARIKGTEYYVRADGAVSVISGSVTVHWNLPGNQGDVTVVVSAGYTFDPTTQTIVATTPEYLQNIIAHIDTTRNNAETFKIGKANLVIKPADGNISPSKPKGNNGVGNGIDPQPPGNPPINDGPGTGPGNPGNKGGAH
ncbi:MAG: hypothetical protein EXS35_14965 [Pedosphaera sp.]|nr:hypothetical protein [Pedosphaera sp.]